jgi:hypothetical protein
MSEHRPAVRRPARPRGRVVALVTLAVVLSLALLASVGGVLLDQRLDRRVSEAVACRLPDGVTLTDADVRGNPYRVALTRETDGIDLDVAVGTEALEGLLGRARPGLGDPQLSISEGLLGVTVSRADVPATLVLEPTVTADGVRLRPESVRVGDRIFAPTLFEGLLDGWGDRPPAPGGALPDGVRITDVEVGEDSLDVELAVPARTAERLAADPRAACS